MSNYRAGDIIRLTRIAIGMTQEELCDNICGIQTLHRIENGKVAVKRDIYYRLMEKMNRIPEQNYAVCAGKNMELLEERIYFEDAVRKEDYHKAEKYLQIIERKADDNVVTRQCVKKMKALIAFYTGKITQSELVDTLKEVIKMTVPEYEVYYERGYPFTEQEILALMSLANALDRNESYEESKKIYRMLLCCLSMDYMTSDSRIDLEITIMRNMANTCTRIGEHAEAIVIYKKALDMSRKCDYGRRYTVLFAEMAWSMLQEIKSGQRDSNDTKKAEQYLRQAYYIAAARKEENLMKITERIYWDAFGRKLD
ncbi:MAG: helix-turn-helix transcriptional regulator [Clostridiales bacterium]|nr:helix-turn-helix transcriptional regulator [Clostridiales bacterium]